MKKTIVLIASVVLGCLTGCQEQKKSVSQITGQPDIKLSAVAQFLRKDGSRYLTEQQYEVYSKPEVISITAKEPFGKITWSIQNGIYTIQKDAIGRERDKELYDLMTNKAITEGLLKIYLAGLEEVQTSAAGQESLNFDGQVYELVAQADSTVKIYQGKSSGEIDLAVSKDDKDGKVYLLHCYNYLKMKKNNGKNAFYPSKLDIYLYRTDFDKELMAQINFSLK